MTVPGYISQLAEELSRAGVIYRWCDTFRLAGVEVRAAAAIRKVRFKD